MKRKDPQASGSLKNYFQVIKNLIRSYATDDLLVEDEFGVTKWIQGERMTEADLENVLWIKALPCGSVFYESKEKGIYIEGLRR